MSYYHCQHCRESTVLEIICPCCSLGNAESFPHSEGESLFDDFLNWLNIQKNARLYVYQTEGNPKDWGYAKACEVIEYELQRMLKEHKDGTDRIRRDKELLGDEIP